MKIWIADQEDETLVETSWERQMHLAGMEAFEMAKYGPNGQAKKAAGTQTGQKVIRKFINRAGGAILEMQQNLLGIRRVSQNVRATVLMVPEDMAAIITLRALIDRTYGAAQLETGYNFQALCREVSQAIEQELNYRNWIRESIKDAKEYAKEKGYSKPPKSLAERLIEDKIKEGGMDRKTYYRWRKTFEELNEYQWDDLEYHYCGEALITAVVGELDDVFEIFAPRARGKTVKHVRMTPEFRKKFDNMEYQISKMQVIRKPMLARPKRWTKHEE